MSVSPEWEKWYAGGGAIEGWYPELMRLIKIFVVEADRLLELGAGSGGTIRMLRERGLPYHGVEGSESAVARLHGIYPDLKDQIVVGDFTQALPFGGGFDVIIDRASIAHNDSEGIRRTVDLIYDALKPGGIFISSDWFSTWHSEFTRGRRLEPRTRTDYPDGQFRGIGRVHFSDEEEFSDLFAKFDGLHIEERIVRRSGPNRLVPFPVDFRTISRAFAGMDYRTAVFDLVVRKPA